MRVDITLKNGNNIVCHGVMKVIDTGNDEIILFCGHDDSSEYVIKSEIAEIEVLLDEG